MADEWIQKLAERIVAVDMPLEREINAREHKLTLIAAHSHGYFKTFAEFLKLYSDEMQAELVRGGIESNQTCTITNDECAVSLNRYRLPHVSISGTFQPNAHVMSVSYATVNPEFPKNSSVPSNNLPCRFEVTDRGSVYAVVDGHDFHHAKDAAKYTVEKAFTFPSLSR